jgi:Chitobiase/beta-hexosaminidase C-terminal domain
MPLIILAKPFLSGPPTCATPTFAPGAGAYMSAQTVTISCATPFAIIYYTTDGSMPTVASSLYTAPIVVASSQTINAIAAVAGYLNSAVGSAAYAINVPAATPTFSPVAGTYAGTQSVSISCSTSASTIYYTTNGSTPTTGSTVYAGPINVSVATTVKAIATAAGYTTSAVASAAYSFSAAATPTFSPVAGAYASPQTVSISCATAGATIYYTTNGSTPTTASPVYSSPVTVSVTETVQALATATGYTNSAIGAATYTIGAAPTYTAQLAALANATIGVAYSTTIEMTAGAGGPYTNFLLVNYSSDQKAASGVYAAPTPQNTWAINSTTGALTCTPAGAENDYFLISAKDNTATTVQQYFSCNVSAALSPLVIATPMVVGNFPQGAVYTNAAPLATLTAVGNVAAVSWTLTSQTSTGTSNSLAVNASTGNITGTLTNLGTTTLNVSASDGTYTATAQLMVTVNQYVTGCPRPAYNTGAGFFVYQGELYDANGNLFRIRGCDRAHYDGSSTGYIQSESGFNAVRYELYKGVAESTMVSDFTSQHLNNHQFVISMRYYGTSGGTTTGSTQIGPNDGGSSATGLGNVLSQWVSAYSAYSAVMNKICINFANEWGPGNSAVYGNVYEAVNAPITALTTTTLTFSGASPFNSTNIGLGYVWVVAGGVSAQLCPVTATSGNTISGTFPSGFTSGGTVYGGVIGVMRAQGWTCPIVLDSGTSGQDYSDFENYAATIFNSDPQKNLIFSYHLYGNTTTEAQFTAGLANFATLAAANGMHFGCYEFGPYKDGSDSSLTQIPTANVLRDCEQYGVSWAGWAMDDHTGSSGQGTDNSSFCMKYQDTDNGYPSNKTQWGKYIMLDPLRGAMVNARQQTSF